jgi:SSS family solute:Na+ symporter
MLVSVIVIVAYLAFFTLAGLYLNRSNKSDSDWANGGGTMGVWLLAAGVAGTRIGGAGTYGVAGDVMQTGLGNLWYGVNSFTALALVGLFFAIPYRRLGLSSVGQVFDLRFGSRRCQSLTSLCVQTEYLVVNIIEPFVIGSIITGVTGLPFGISVFIGGFVILFFTATGGLKGTAITNLVHCGIVIIGLSIVALFAMQDMGGWAATAAQADAALDAAGMDKATWWSVTGIGWVTIIALSLSATLHTPAASVYANYAASAKSEKSLIPAFLLAGVLAALMPFIAGVIGVETFAKYGAGSGISSYRNITQLAIDTGPIIGGIALAAVLAALISSGAPMLLGSATMFVNDWVPGSKQFSKEKRLKAYKLTAVIYGLVATIIAWQANISSVLQLLLLGFAMVVPPAIAITFMFYWRKTSEKAAFYGILLGYGGGLLHWSLNTLFDGTESSTAGGFAEYWYGLLQSLGEWGDPTFSATLIPLFVIPILTMIYPDDHENSEYAQSFYKTLKTPGRSIIAGTP